MTTVSFYSLTVPADQPSALFGSWVRFDARGMCPRTLSASGYCGRISGAEKAVPSNPQYSGVTSPSVVRSGAADSEVAPQWSTLIAQCQLPRVASCPLRLSRAGCDLLPPSR